MKILGRSSGGPPPGYQWTVVILEPAYEEARTFLNEDRYAHMARQMKKVGRQDEPTRADTVDVRPIEDYHEVRDKGGVLGKLNVRVFFGVHKPSRTLVVLGAIKKEHEGSTGRGDKKRIARRWHAYLNDLKSRS